MSEPKEYKILARVEVPAHEYLRNEAARMHHIAGGIATGMLTDSTALLELAKCLSETLDVLALLQERNDVLR